MEICIVLATIFMLFLYTIKSQSADSLMKEIIKARTQYEGIAEAVILEVTKKQIMRGMVYYYPTFLYEVNGNSYGESELIFSTRGSDFPTGKKVQVRYDQSNPKSFMPVDDEELYQMAKSEKNTCGFMIIASCVLCGIALLYPNAFVR